jgi:hypothetical protein
MGYRKYPTLTLPALYHIVVCRAFRTGSFFKKMVNLAPFILVDKYKALGMTGLNMPAVCL